MRFEETLAVGVFDGVHLGHQKILCGATAALTFRNHPISLLVPERAPRLIMTPEERIGAIRACGVEHVTMLTFTRQVADMSPSEFLAEYVFAGKGPGRSMKILCGENWRFGRGGQGDADFARKAGAEVEVMPYAEYKGERICSTRIRGCLERGEIEDANAMMGRRFRVRGQRTEGKGLGTKLGFPTINLKLPTLDSRLVTLPNGVYEVELNGMRGVANYGLAPTMGKDAWTEPVLEVHLLKPRISGAELQVFSAVVEVVRFIRPERKFASVEDLKRQVAADCATVSP